MAPEIPAESAGINARIEAPMPQTHIPRLKAATEEAPSGYSFASQACAPLPIKASGQPRWNPVDFRRS
ncbi:hypothetical protein SAMN05428945_3952 [Streptomyces sp. 2224.1]|nr:hypothetical protein BX261_1385 [Streptomyces sp. 2321.6]SDR54612.1 hypothetical protein SAMN05216511_5831 [Streptomyces sp. KS_16]SEC18260.1 hypothetical protein SAMN05428940_1385 [Streptomyces sp. 2133.1]SED13686.1 hypothetical protein SAMN05428945_3952 [Streptomyces sp. 2224.1]SEF07316.1 hypothetical protein SAMN05428954_5894 [Streptomyces sp. 2112.3]SNC65674.1 hypothetical protein SAMN06272741_1383 [Streptomyces sp. 2114.4]